MHHGSRETQVSKERRLDDGARDGRKWSLVLLCLLAQNCVMGFAFGSFGPLLASTEQDFGVSRALATAGMSLITLALGGLSPVLGGWMERVSVRTGMAGGALLSAIGYVGLACAGSFAVALGMYGLIGIGVCLTAILGPLILISRWFDKNRGKVLSIVNLPILLFLTPYIVAKLLPHYGRAGLLSAMGAICALLALLLLRLVEPAPVAAHQAQPGVPAAQCASGASLLKRPAFWLLSLGIGIMAGAGTGFVVHIVPFGMCRQMPLQAAAALLSVYAGAGIGGTLLFGWICDRIGAPAALALSAFLQAALWWGLLLVDGTHLYALAGLLGICVVPLVTLHGAAISQMFGIESVSRAMGYSYSIKLPFILGFAPALGLIFDRVGRYDLAFLATASLLTAAGVFLCCLLLILRRQRSLPAVPAIP
ncbi:major facilitator superfamily MFS_1 (plasmid) [Cupriavidus necator N-1]|uniref:Major facilitator superfamily MFS_1 n=1 Tax=Cupriavidus necator (strain ATCC 43291 / DSM 13513 / CCUG 52238 / LMG 8453 / N-1) TaxID=1042878 RepID=F8GWZ4_CUPNN|nr:major facilitator superfamily MFS_1 [Cupriavidus necator N-1]